METRFSAPVQTGPGAHPASCTMGTGSFPGVKSGRGVTLTPHPLLVPWSRKSTAIPLLPLWAVRPVQSLSACTRVHFTFTLPPTQWVPGVRFLGKRHPTLFPPVSMYSICSVSHLSTCAAVLTGYKSSERHVQSSSLNLSTNSEEVKTSHSQ